MTTKEQLLKYVAPCSLLCYTCPGYKDGVICKGAKDLCNYFAGYQDFLDSHGQAGEEFSQFYRELSDYSLPKCDGCRENPDPMCSIKGCVIPTCSKEHGVDFCGECRKFPCEKVNEKVYSKIVIDRWRSGNLRIRAIGAVRFFEEESKLSHYRGYIKHQD